MLYQHHLSFERSIQYGHPVDMRDRLRSKASSDGISPYQLLVSVWGEGGGQQNQHILPAKLHANCRATVFQFSALRFGTLCAAEYAVQNRIALAGYNASSSRFIRIRPTSLEGIKESLAGTVLI